MLFLFVQVWIQKKIHCDWYFQIYFGLIGDKFDQNAFFVIYIVHFWKMKVSRCLVI